MYQKLFVLSETYLKSYKSLYLFWGNTSCGNNRPVNQHVLNDTEVGRGKKGVKMGITI